MSDFHPTGSVNCAELLSQFAASLRQCIVDSDPNSPEVTFSEDDFNERALQLFGLQFSANAPYRAWCELRRATPESVSDWRQIPMVPTDAFKEVDLFCLDRASANRWFHSSGTTGHRPSRHYHFSESLALYEESLSYWFARHLLADAVPNPIPGPPNTAGRLAMVSLTPPPNEVPHSSLVHMIQTIMGRWGSGDSAFIGFPDVHGDWSLNWDRLLQAIRFSTSGNEPLLLLGTAFNFVHFLDWAEQEKYRFSLPQGSRIMETGGYKGRSRVLSAGELHAALSERLGIAPPHIVTEYGMCELSSQAYDRRVGGRGASVFQFPPWTRPLILSPENRREVAVGETGLLGIIDLANAWSVLGVQTGDLAVRLESGFLWVGRIAQSEPRGCSLLSV